MVNGSLTDYVRTQLQRGYSPEAIRTTLIRAGYNPQDVDFALRTASRALPKRLELTGRNLAILVGGLLAILLLIVSGFLLFRPGPKDIQLALRMEQEKLLPGDTLTIATTLTSMQAHVVPVALTYVVTDTASRKVITSRSERLDVGTSAFSSQRIPLSVTLSAGDYEVRLTAQYRGLTRVQTARFTVQPPTALPEEERVALPEEPFAPIELECPPSCDDLNPATEDRCERGSCVHVLKEGVCGNAVCDPGENQVNCPEDCGRAQDPAAVQAQAVQVAPSDPEKAATLCTSMVIPQNTDPCFAAAANISRRSALCANIQDLRARDRCLFEFALANDFSVCTQLTNRYLLTSCQSLQRFSTAPQEQAAAEAEAQRVGQEAA
jgi:hypothetical protein